MRVADVHIVDIGPRGPGGAQPEPAGSRIGTSDDRDAALAIDLEMHQDYRHSLGRSSPFFIGLGEGKLQATSCRSCAATYFPPRSRCPADGHQTDWYELPGTGRIVAATVVHSPPPFGGIEAPYVLASIRLDEVDGGLTHRVIGTDAPAAGTAVTVRFLDEPHAHPLLSIAFAPDAAPATGDEVAS